MPYRHLNISANFRARAGRRLAAARKERRLSQTELAESLGITQQMVSEVERGRRGFSDTIWAAAARGLQVTIDWLLHAEEREESRMPKEKDRSGPGRHITHEEHMANYRLIEQEPMLALKVKTGRLSIEDIADIADYIRKVKAGEVNVERPSE